ncbi:MAG: hypothetical protein JW732_09875 [Dehalococcoidia bacterium]|nr:hypothetical protein [Dehalococcoidia bacterium]
MELTDFVTENRESEIGKDVIAIPENARPEFYRLFDIVRTTFLEENFSNLLRNSEALSDVYTKVEEEVIKLLMLDDLSMPIGLHRFLGNPQNQLIRGLFDPLFDLLRGKTNVEAFAAEASRSIENAFTDLYQLGYGKWVVLSLVKLLECNKCFHISLRQPSFKEMVKRLPTHREPVPLPSESQHLSFEQERMPILVVPDFIVYSPKVGAYIAVRSGFKSATLIADDINERNEWYTFDSIREKSGPASLKFDFAVYIAGHPEDLALIADSRIVLRPDLIIECIEQKNRHEDELENARLCHDILKPKLGTYIVSQEPAPQDVRGKPGADIHVLTVGLNQSKLSPIINVLANYKN